MLTNLAGQKKPLREKPESKKKIRIKRNLVLGPGPRAGRK
jgi:hypothetical protein